VTKKVNILPPPSAVQNQTLKALNTICQSKEIRFLKFRRKSHTGSSLSDRALRLTLKPNYGAWKCDNSNFCTKERIVRYRKCLGDEILSSLQQRKLTLRSKIETPPPTQHTHTHTNTTSLFFTNFLILHIYIYIYIYIYIQSRDSETAAHKGKALAGILTLNLDTSDLI
jgi:hypothetical protein